MHVYPQSQWHMPVDIRGTTEALVALRDALDRALAEGTAKATAYANDGEGYEINIHRVNVLNLLGPLPYFHEYARDDMHEEWKAPPEPFDPDQHAVIIRVGADGQPLPIALEPPDHE